MKDVQVTITLELSTTGKTKQEILEHALGVLMNSYEVNGTSALLDSCEVQEQ